MYKTVLIHLRAILRVDADTCSYIAERLYTLRDNIHDKRNFGVKVLDRNSQVLVKINVSGGFKSLTRRKYRVTGSRVERYDWLSKLWKVIAWIADKVNFKVVRRIIRKLPAACKIIQSLPDLMN
jgi:hypothetical protein